MQPTSSMVKKKSTHTRSVLISGHECAWVMSVLLLSGLSVSIPGLEKALHQYTLEPSDKPFDMKSVPLATTPITEQKTGTTPHSGWVFIICLSRIWEDKHCFFSEITPAASSKLPEKLAPSRQDIYQGKLAACHQVKGQGLHRLNYPFSTLTEQLAAIPEFQGLGPLFKSSEPVQLTEAETEYVVRCIKHTFARHMVFQFDCTNTLNDQLLQRVSLMVHLRLFQESSSPILTQSVYSRWWCRWSRRRPTRW